MQGVLLVNLGSPDSPSTADVRRYLREFLMDPRVIDVPYLARLALVEGCILPFRPKQSAHAYAQIWTAEGSPLIATTRRVADLLEERLGAPVDFAMRYGNPRPETALHRLAQCGVDEILIAPMFPQYAMSSYESAVERVSEAVHKVLPGVRTGVLPPYYDHPEYIHALHAVAEPYLRIGFDHVLLSFHGVPERHIRKTNEKQCLSRSDCCKQPHATCYRNHCYRTAGAFASAAGLPEQTCTVAFQSRLGRDAWLRPYTHDLLVQMGRARVGRLLVLCPAFTTDCLETIEEIGIRGRETFQQAGGGSLHLIPCLNDHPAWIDGLANLVRADTSTVHNSFAPAEHIIKSARCGVCIGATAP